jgi:hypothetical protein
MLKVISKFASSPFSGYAFIVLALAAGGAAYWFWTELKEFGSLETVAEQQEQKIKELNQKAEYEKGRADMRFLINSELSKTVASINEKYRNVGVNFAKELLDAPQEYINCRNMLVPTRLRHPDAQDEVLDD